VQGPSVRTERIDLDHAQRLRPVLDQVPPILVRPRGDKYEVIDGQHRRSASEFEGRSTIRAVIVTLTDEEALEAAVAANVHHGLPLKAHEREGAARKLIGATDWSNRRIAEACGLSHPTVAKLRPVERSGGNDSHLNARSGGDGKSYPATKADADANRDKARDIARNDPGIPTRKLAALAGCSDGTAHSVKTEIAAEQTPPPLSVVSDPAPEQEPTVDDLVPSVAMPWVRDERCQVSNEARAFARAMDRFTGDALADVEDSIVNGCPAGAVAHMAVIHAREAAATWTRIAEALARPRTLKEA
jgi:ParB-like chromosome segregation protein Spo0J